MMDQRLSLRMKGVRQPAGGGGRGNHRRSGGFTLIELMIVVIVIGILAAIAIPGYQNYVRKARRTDAKNALLTVQVEETKWRTNNSTFTATLANLGLTSSSPDGYYTISITNQTGGAYTANGTGVTAKAVAVASTSQNLDTGCTTLYLRSGTDIDSTHPEKDPATCW